MTVHHRQPGLVMLLADHAAGIHAEGAHLVLIGIGVIDQLGLVKIFGQVIYNKPCRYRNHCHSDGHYFCRVHVPDRQG